MDTLAIQSGSAVDLSDSMPFDVAHITLGGREVSAIFNATATTKSQSLPGPFALFAYMASYKGPIMTTSQNSSDRYLRTKEAAKLLSLSFRTLEKHRVYGTGPRFLKLGGRVVYKIEDLHSWASRGSRGSTSDKGHGIVLPAKRHDPSVMAHASEVADPGYE